MNRQSNSGRRENIAWANYFGCIRTLNLLTALLRKV